MGCFNEEFPVTSGSPAGENLFISRLCIILLVWLAMKTSKSCSYQGCPNSGQRNYFLRPSIQLLYFVAIYNCIIFTQAISLFGAYK